MTELVTNGAGTPETVTNDRLVTPPKRDRAAYMRAYRARQSEKPEIREPNKEINSEPKLESGITEPEIKSEQFKSEPNNPSEPITAEKHAGDVARADEAAQRLKDQIAAIDRSREVQQQQQVRAEQLALAQQLFHIWKSEGGLNQDEERFLLAHGPDVIIGLSNFAANEASRLGHQAWSPEYIEAAKHVFHENVRHLEVQARTNAKQADQSQSVEEPMPAIPAMPAPAFFEPTPAPLPPRRQAPSRSGIVSAPVTRETGLLSDSFDRKQQHTLSAQEVEAARISGVTPAEYLKQKLKYQALKAQGQVE